MMSRNLLIASFLGLLLAGCGITSNKNADYRSQGGKIPSLDVPPDLTSPVADDRFVIPDSKATTFSTYNRDRSAVPVSGNTVLPKIENARIERVGEQRWLVVKSTSDVAWTTAKEFWAEAGFVLNRESPETGIMETDWAENRSKVPQDIVRRTIGRLLDSLYETGLRDKFRTRLEPGREPGTIDIYISHRGVEEVYANSDKIATAWQPRPNDKELEAEMLSRLMVKFGFTAPAATTLATASGGSAAPANVSRASYDKNAGGALTVNEPFDRAWRRVGLALDRVGFTVEDRDRSKGLFFVRYIDPDAEARAGSDKGFLDKLAFWRKDDPLSKPQYRVYVVEAAGVSSVTVQSADGKPDNSSTAKRILGLLLEQLR
ncbi:MAG: outer membrane protein assembly factor BamC [Betaproteobacteria bacterium]